MPEPTIDEMLEWVDMYDRDGIPQAIRAILEQVQAMEQLGVRKQIELEAVRGFVARVENRHRHYDAALRDELAEMEKEHA